MHVNYIFTHFTTGGKLDIQPSSPRSACSAVINVVAIHTKLDIPTLNDRRMQVLPISFWPVLDDGYIQPIMVIVLFSNNGDCLFVR